MKPSTCRHTREDGSSCRGWANATGRCPLHAGQMPRGPRTSNAFTVEKKRGVERRRWAQRKVRESAA